MHIIVLDDDGAGVFASKTNLSISEAGRTDLYTVRLASQPKGTVIVTLTADPAAKIQVGDVKQMNELPHRESEGEQQRPYRSGRPPA
eukprot:4745965-Pyramimonas_sp.AAC.1